MPPNLLPLRRCNCVFLAARKNIIKTCGDVMNAWEWVIYTLFAPFAIEGVHGKVGVSEQRLYPAEC